MAMAESTVIRDAQPGADDDAVVLLMTDYMTWAHERLANEFGVHEPPADPAEIRHHLDDYRPPKGGCLAPAGRGSDHGCRFHEAYRGSRPERRSLTPQLSK